MDISLTGKSTDDVEEVLVPLKVLKELQETAKFMRALEAAGVSNWDGYEIAQDYVTDE